MAVIGIGASSATYQARPHIPVPESGIKPGLNRILELKPGSGISEHFSLPEALKNNLSSTVQSKVDQEHLTATLQVVSQGKDDRGHQVWNTQPINDMANFFERNQRPPINVVFADIPKRPETQIYQEGFVTSDWNSRNEQQYSWMPSSIRNSNLLKDVLDQNLSTQMMFVLPRGEKVETTARRLTDLLGAAKTALTNKNFPMWTGKLPTFNLSELEKIDAESGLFKGQPQVEAFMFRDGIVDGRVASEAELAPSRTKYIDQQNSWSNLFE